MSNTTDTSHSAGAADYAGMDEVQTLAAAAADPQGFEAAIAAALEEASHAPAAAPQTTPPTAAEAAPQTQQETQAGSGERASEAGRFTPDVENQLRALQQSFAQREQENAALAEQLAQLRAQLPATGDNSPPEKTPQTAAPAFQVDPAIFGDLSEAAIAKGMEQVVNTIIPQLRQEMREQAQQLVEKKIEPVAKQQQQSAQQAHESAILAKHPDAHQAIESSEFRQWLQALPSFSQNAVMNVIHQGTTEQVVEMLDTFKSSLPKTESTTTIPPQKAAPEKPTPVPLSLSHVPGSAPQVDPLAALSEASGEAQLVGISNMNAAQLEALMRAAQSAALN